MTASEPAPDEPVQQGPTHDAPTPPPAHRSFMDDLAAPEPAHPPGGYSLASLFLLVTAAGVIALLARKIVETEIEVTVVTIHALIGGLIGGIAGAIVGGGYPRPAVSVPLGWLVGTLTGAICAATAASGGSPWLFVVGAVALVALGVASRWMHSS